MLIARGTAADIVSSLRTGAYCDGDSTVGLDLTSRARLVGGVCALLLGLFCLDVFPLLGVAETALALIVLFTRHPLACLVAMVPTALIIATAIEVMVQVSGPANPVMWPVIALSIIIEVALLKGAIGAEHVAAPHG